MHAITYAHTHFYWNRQLIFFYNPRIKKELQTEKKKNPHKVYNLFVGKPAA